MKQHYGEEGAEEEDAGVKGFMDLNTFLMKVRLRALVKYILCILSSGIYLHGSYTF